MPILDNFQSLLFCFPTFGFTRPMLALEPWIRIRIECHYEAITDRFLLILLHYVFVFKFSKFPFPAYLYNFAYIKFILFVNCKLLAPNLTPRIRSRIFSSTRSGKKITRILPTILFFFFSGTFFRIHAGLAAIT